MNTTTTAAGWAAWHRRTTRRGYPPEPWRKILEAADFSTCWGEMLLRLRTLAPGGETAVLRAGQVPTPPRPGRMPR